MFSPTSSKHRPTSQNWPRSQFLPNSSAINILGFPSFLKTNQTVRITYRGIPIWFVIHVIRLTILNHTGTTSQYSGAERPTKQKRPSASHGQPGNSRRHCRVSSRSSISSSISNSSGIATPLLDQSACLDAVQDNMQQTYLPSTKPPLMIMNQRHLSDSYLYTQSYHTPYQPQERTQDDSLFMANLLTSHETQQPSSKYPTFGYHGT